MGNSKADTLARWPMWAQLSRRERENLATNLDDVNIRAGSTLIREGEMNDTFYIVQEGQVEVAIGGHPVKQLGPGDYFGEISMDQRVPATATVTAKTPLRVFVMSHRQFNALAGGPILHQLRSQMIQRVLADMAEWRTLATRQPGTVA